MEEKEKYEAGQEPNAPGPDAPPEQGGPSDSILQVQFAGPGIADITSMQTQGEVTLGQLTFLGVFLIGQALTNLTVQAMHGVVKATMLEALKEAFAPKIERAQADFRIPPDLLRND